MAQIELDGDEEIAFPYSYTLKEEDGYETVYFSRGMTLRDYFAAKVMEGMAAGFRGIPNMSDEGLLESARFYYRMADAMMKAKEEK